MKNNIIRFCKSSALICFSALIMTSCGGKEEVKNDKKNEEKQELTVKPAFEIKNMDMSVKPGENFFKYVNGGWMKANPIPEEYSLYGVFNKLKDENDKNIRKMFEDVAATKDAPKGSIEQKIGDFYNSGLDEKKINSAGIKPLEAELKNIDDIKNSDDVQKAIAHFHSYTIYPLFVFFADQDEMNSEAVVPQLFQGGLGLPDRDYYLSDDTRSKEIRAEYLKHLEKMFGFLGDDEKLAKEEAEKIMKLETEIAKVSFTRKELRDPHGNYNKMNIEDLQKLAPAISWKNYFKNLGLEQTGDIIVKQKPFIKGISGIFQNTSVDDWKIYLRWNLINNYAGYLNEEISKQNFAFYGTTLTGAKKQHERWKRVLGVTSASLGELVGQLYVKKYFPKEAKDKMLDLVGNLKKSLHERISNLSWMGEETKAKALEKLDKMNVKVGYPDKWIDYSSLDITKDSYVTNVMNANKFSFNYNLNKIGKPVDRGEWGMTPQTINAYYNPVMNEIVFPAAILQPPFFNLNADDAVNYAAIGTIIGHEMTHGFDDQGRQYDVNGNMNDWWTEEDAKHFTEKTKVLVDQYNNLFAEIDGEKHHVDGELTLGENIADFGGITVSLNAFKYVMDKKAEKIDGFTPLQRFFLSYAQIWRQNIRDKELMRRLKEDVHSPGRFRVNGIVPNVPEFYQAFEITESDPLFKAEQDRAIIW